MAGEAGGFLPEVVDLVMELLEIFLGELGLEHRIGVGGSVQGLVVLLGNVSVAAAAGARGLEGVVFSGTVGPVGVGWGGGTGVGQDAGESQGQSVAPYLHG